MYFVSVPANACDDQTGSHQDNASQKPTKADLRLVETPVPFAITTTEATETDPSALAARILQLHAASEPLERYNCRPPKLVGEQDEPGFDIPGVLKRNTGIGQANTLDPSPVPQPRKTKARAESRRSGPSFKALLFSTALVVAAAGTAVFFLKAPSAETAPDSRDVVTERIATEPTIESLIDADRSAQQSDDNAPPVSPSQAQIESAKNRIRNAFAASGRISANPASLATPVEELRSAETGKAQARLETVSWDQQATTSPHMPASLPRLASASAATITVPNYTVTDQSPAPAISEPPVIAPDSSSAPQTSEAPVDLQQTGSPTADYPNTGTVVASVNLRQSDDKDGSILTTIPAGTEVRFGSCGTWWCGVSYQGQTGFVGQKFLERTQ